MERSINRIATGNGRRLSHGQLRQLQWIVPLTWCEELARALSELPIAGAGVRSCLLGTERWLGFFDAGRMVDEALRPAAYPLLSGRGLLPVAGCGRRGPAVYLVEVGDPSLPLWLLHGSEPLQELGVGLLDVWRAATLEPRVQLRRRIPEKSPRRLAKTQGAPRGKEPSQCSRTLSLFA